MSAYKILFQMRRLSFNMRNAENRGVLIAQNITYYMAYGLIIRSYYMNLINGL